MKIKLYFAPIRGFTNALYRNLYAEFFSGFDIAVAPFISTIQSEKIKKSHIKDILPENNSGIPIIPQILSNDPTGFIRLAKFIGEAGYEIVNWNLGCPFPMVAKKKRGSGLLPYTGEIESFLDRVIPAIPNRLSIKTRSGRETDTDILKLIPVFNKYPIDEIIIHPRIGMQMYDGKPDLDIFEKCLQLSKHPVVYNGDIKDLETFHRLSDRFSSVNRWMIGRWGIANPFLPEIICKNVDNIHDKNIIFKKFHDELFYRYRQYLRSPSHILDKMKGYWNYFSWSFENGRKIFKKIKKIKKVDNYIGIVEDFFLNNPEWK